MVGRLAWRSVWRNKRRTLITMVSIGLGLTVAIFFIATAEGVYSQVVNDGVRMQAGHITLEHPDYLAAPAVDLYIDGVREFRESIQRLAGVERTKLLVLGQGVANSASGAVGVSIMGIEPSVERETSPLTRHIVAGSYLSDDDERKVVIGEALARQLNVQTGKKLVITTNNAAGELVEELCRVEGIFRTGSVEIDGYLIQIPITFARRVFGLGPDSATQLGVILGKGGDQEDLISKIKDMVGGKSIAVLPWQEILPEVAAYIRLDRTSNLVFQGLLLMIIFFTILNTLLMSVVEREREFAVLLALGTPRGLLRRQLLVESLYIGLLGCTMGLTLGGSISWAVEVWGWDIGYLMPEGVTISGLAISSVLHARLTLPILAWTGSIVLVATLLLSFMPMRRIARVQLAETLR